MKSQIIALVLMILVIGGIVMGIKSCVGCASDYYKSGEAAKDLGSAVKDFEEASNKDN